MKRLFTANVTALLGEDQMRIKVHKGNTYTVAVIPGIRENALLAVVKEPSADTCDMVMRMVDYKKTYATPSAGPAEPDTVEWDDTPDNNGVLGSGCSQPEW
jgi:hypothetical protein